MTTPNHSQRKHATLSPSGSHRWMSCPGSLRLCAQLPKRPESEYAAEGTAAHELAELCLRNNRQAADYVGEVIRLTEEKEYAVTVDMAEAVQVYLDEIRDIVGESNTKDLMIEKRFDLGWLYPGIFGSNDCCFLDESNKNLYVWDYKHGRGVVVEPDWNSQLMIYALGALAEIHKLTVERTKQPCNLMDLVHEVVLVIVQPNAYHEEGKVRSWSIKTSDLLFWGMNILKPAAIKTESSDVLIDGEHCRFCDAIAVCPQQMKTVMATAKTDFDRPIFPAPESLSADDIIKVLKVSENVKTWVSQVKAYAQSKMEMGVALPGFKLVRGKANRRWINEALAAQKLEERLGDEAYKKEVLSVAQAEKALKAKKFAPEAELSGLWEKPLAGLSMVEESDPRKPVEPETCFTPVNMLEWNFLE